MHLPLQLYRPVDDIRRLQRPHEVPYARVLSPCLDGCEASPEVQHHYISDQDISSEARPTRGCKISNWDNTGKGESRCANEELETRLGIPCLQSIFPRGVSIVRVDIGRGNRK